MYKKIAHTILEEHFDSPPLVPPPARNIVAPKIRGTMANAGFDAMFLAFPYNTDPAIVLRMTNQDYFVSLCTSIRIYLRSLMESDMELPLAESRIGNQINDFKSLFLDYYTIPDSMMLDQHFKSWAESLIRIMKLVKNGGDLTMERQTNSGAIDMLAQTLHNLNPEYWKLSDLILIFTDYTDSIIIQCNATLDTSWFLDRAAAARSFELMVWGDAMGTLGFANILTNGIVLQFPDKFNPPRNYNV